MELNKLFGEKSKGRQLKLSLLAAAILSILYTTALAYVIYGSLLYPVNHLIFDLVYAFLYFLLLHEAYRLIYRWQEKRLSFLKNLFQRYLAGLGIFIVVSLLLVFVVGIFPFLYILQMEPIGHIDFTSELRLNVVVNILFSSVYYTSLTGFNALRNYHKATLDAQILQKEIAQARYEGLKTR